MIYNVTKVAKNAGFRGFPALLSFFLIQKYIFSFKLSYSSIKFIFEVPIHLQNSRYNLSSAHLETLPGLDGARLSITWGRECGAKPHRKSYSATRREMLCFLAWHAGLDSSRRKTMNIVLS